MSFVLTERPCVLPGSAFRRRSLPSGQDMAPLTLVAVTYGGLAVLSAPWATILGPVFQPAAGVAFAALLLGGRRLWPAVLVAQLVASLWLAPERGVIGPLVSAVGATLAAIIASLAIHRRETFDPMLGRLLDVWRLALCGALGGGAVWATAITLNAAVQGAPPATWLGVAVSALMAHAAGVLVVSPLILAWSPPAGRRNTVKSWLHFAAVVGLTLCLTIAIFLQPAAFLRTWHLYPLLVWTALAFNARGSAVGLTILAFGAVVGAHLGLGPNDTSDRLSRLLLAQHMVLVTAATTLVLAAVADERRIARRLEAAQQRAERELVERRRMEDRQRLLINELNHRVKNTLATVQSMIAQTFRGSGCDEPVATLNSRLMALSAAHDVLTREAWDGADVADIVGAAIAPFDAPGATRFGWRGPAVRLAPNMALGLAMALHELATNAAKHGALSSAHGRVAIGWGLERGGDACDFTLNWVERDGPMVAPPTRKGFGSRLLERGLPAQLGGRVTLAFAPQGLRCEIATSLPLTACAA